MWGRRAHLHSGAEVGGLLGVDDVDHIVTTMALRAPAFRLIKGGATLDASTYTRSARIGSRTITDLIDVGRVYAHFADGATIVLQGLHRYWPPVTALCRALEDELTHPLQANAYITPPVAQGLRVHADPHDVFAIQTHGRKQWVLYEGDGTGADLPAGSQTLDTDLVPGDCLYIPKGTRHAARTIDSPSIHLTLGVKTLTWRDVLQGAVDHALADPSLDEALPAGFAHDPAALAEDAGRRLTALVDRVAGADLGDSLSRTARRFWRNRQPALSGQLQQLLCAGAIDDATVVRRRPQVMAEVSISGDRLAVVLVDRTVRMPAAAAPAVRALLAGDQCRVGDLGRHLDGPSRITLVQRLVREGLLMVVDG